MIPKVIHYCWFGGNPLPEFAQKCIASWEKFFPDYTIKEWNESNFDIHMCAYAEEAYSAKKWAFVSDYARFWILYQEGGLYFDTDVEVVKVFDPILERGAFMGCEAPCEYEHDHSKNLGWEVAPGLGLAVEPGHPFYKELLDHYTSRHFLDEAGNMRSETVVAITTALLKKHGYDPYRNALQQVCGIWIYPPEYFCPINQLTAAFQPTQNTYSIHYYDASWLCPEEKVASLINQKLVAKYGRSKGERLARIICFPGRIEMHLRTKGIRGCVQFAVQKIKKCF